MNWQPIETAPKDGTQILVCRVGDDIGAGSVEITEWCIVPQCHYEPAKYGLYRKVDDKPIEFWNGNGHRATHWMPLPRPPQDDDIGELGEHDQATCPLCAGIAGGENCNYGMTCPTPDICATPPGCRGGSHRLTTRV